MAGTFIVTFVINNKEFMVDVVRFTRHNNGLSSLANRVADHICTLDPSIKKAECQSAVYLKLSELVR